MASTPPAQQNQPTAKWLPWHTLALFAVFIGVIPVGLFVPRIWAWILILAGLLAFVAVAGRGTTGYWHGALIDDRNMMSVSRLQMTLWTILILGSFLAATLSNITLDGPRHALDIAIPTQLWALMGIATTSLIASPLIRSNRWNRKPLKTEMDRTMKLRAGRPALAGMETTNRGTELVNKSPKDASWSNLVAGEETGNGAQLDLGKVQNLYFTLILVLGYAAVLGAVFLSNRTITRFPALDTGMVTLLAISHGGYLAFKAAPQSQRAA